MKHINYTYINDNRMPNVDGLEFVWARESQYPTDKPEFFGTCPDGSSVGVAGVIAELSGEQYLAELQQEIADRKLLLTKRNNQAYENALSMMTSDYPPSEIQTWERQRAEVLAWNADPLAVTPWIDVAASARGLDRNEYLSRTLVKVQAFAAASAWLTGRRQGIDDSIRAAMTLEQVSSVSISYNDGVEL
ncbi:MAG: hypothetical protein RBR45_11660 [Pseudomonas sp.]|nr:hypothetical protein [Pseudomonas sp.]